MGDQMGASTADDIATRASELAGPGDRSAAVAELLALAGADRAALEAARDRVADRLHSKVSDWHATATLRLLNSALSGYGWTDPYEWKSRIGRRFNGP